MPDWILSCVGILVGWLPKRVGMKPTPLLLLLSNSMMTAETEASAPTRLSSTNPRSGSTAIARTLGMFFSWAALPISSSVKGMGGSVSMLAGWGVGCMGYSFHVVLVTGRSRFTTAGQGRRASAAHRAACLDAVVQSAALVTSTKTGTDGYAHRRERLTSSTWWSWGKNGASY